MQLPCPTTYARRGNAAAAEQEAVSAPSKDPTPVADQRRVKKVLVIDDSDSVRQQVRQALIPAGYEVMEAIDGVDGLDKIRTGVDINVVLCDVNMPRMNGLDLAATAQAEGLTTPIVMLTSEGQPSMVRRARESGAKAWIVKPFRVEQLLAAMDKITAPAR